MKKIIYFFVITIFIVGISSFMTKSDRQISYIESSSGLQTINLESGRTEIEMVDVTPYDDLSDVDCRWYIEGVGLVFGKDLEKTLKEHFSEEE